MDVTVNITGLKKAELLHRCWEQVKYGEPCAFDWMEAHKRVEAGKIDSICGRPIMLDLSSDSVDPSAFDKLSSCAFADIVASMRYRADFIASLLRHPLIGLNDCCFRGDCLTAATLINDGDKDFALMIAAATRHEDCVNLLLMRGAVATHKTYALAATSEICKLFSTTPSDLLQRLTSEYCNTRVGAWSVFGVEGNKFTALRCHSTSIRFVSNTVLCVCSPPEDLDVLDISTGGRRSINFWVKHPFDIAISLTRFYVASVLGLSTSDRKWDKRIARCIALSRDETKLYACGEFGVDVLDAADLSFLCKISDIKTVHGCAVLSNEQLVVSTGTNICVFDGATLVKSFGDDILLLPTSVAVGPDDSIFVVNHDSKYGSFSHDEGHIVQFLASGAFIKKFGKFTKPTGIAVSSAGVIVVADGRDIIKITHC